MSELITARIRAHALKLGLSHLAESVEVLLARAEGEQLGYLQLLDLLLEDELGLRGRFRNALNLSGLPHRKTLDDFDFSLQPDLDPRKVRDLASLSSVSFDVRPGSDGTNMGTSRRRRRCFDVVIPDIAASVLNGGASRHEGPTLTSRCCLDCPDTAGRRWAMTAHRRPG